MNEIEAIFREEKVGKERGREEKRRREERTCEEQLKFEVEARVVRLRLCFLLSKEGKKKKKKRERE